MDSTEKTRAIVLKTIKYGDNSLIAKLLTDNNGLQSFMIKGAFNKSAKIRAALFQPLTLLDVVSAKSHGELGYLKEATVEHSYKSIPFDIKKSAIVLFISELISKTIQEGQADINLFTFTHRALTHLDDMDCSCADFPLKFAIGLSWHLGFAPNINNYKQGLIFDLEEGGFVHNSANAIYIIDNQYCDSFYKLCKNDVLDDEELHIRNHERRQLLEYVITYFKLHVSGFNEMKSSEILKTVLQ